MNRQGTHLLLSLVFVFICAGPVRATGLVPASGPLGPPLQDLSKLTINSATHPAEDAVILYRGVEVRILPDGRMSRRVRLVQRLLRDLAVTQNGDPVVAYDTTREEVAIHQCRTLMRDGREVGARPRAFNRVTPERVATCPDRAGLQEMVISYLGLELGCLTELDYTVSDRAPFRPWCEGMEEMGSKYPVLQGEIVIRAPDDAVCRTALGMAGTPLKTKEETGPGFHRFTWGALPGYPDEGGLSLWDREPFLVYSTCVSWDVLFSWISGRVREQAAADSSLTQWCRGPMANHRLPLDATERFGDLAWLLEKRTTHNDDARLDWWLPPRPAPRTFSTSCGNLLDRAVLAAACLGVWGMEAGVTLHPVLSRLVREVPALSQFDDLWLRSGPAFLPVAHGTVGPRPDPGWAEELVDGSEGRCRFTLLPPRRGSGFLSLVLREQPDGTVSGDAALRIGSGLCQGLDLADVKGFLQKLATTYAAHGELASYRVRALTPDTCDVVFAFTGKGLGDSLGGGRRRVLLPSVPGVPQAILSGSVNLRRDVRSEPLLLRCLAREEVYLRLVLGEQTKAAILPRAESIRAAGAAFERSVRQDGQAIIVERTLEATRRMIDPSDYPEFRALMDRRTDGAANSILLEPTGSKR